MSKFKHSLITKNTERVDAIMSIDKVKSDPDNPVLYGENDSDYYKALKNNIRLKGLKNPIVIYKDGTIKSGHTRYKITIELGYDTIPVQFSIVDKPPRGFDNMMSLMAENQTRPSDIARQYNQIKTASESYEASKGQRCTDKVIKEIICPTVQMSFNMYSQLRELYNDEIYGRSKFVKVMKTNGSAMSPGYAHSRMLKDRKNAANNAKLKTSTVLDELLTKQDIVFAASAVSNVMSQIENISFNGRDGKDINIFDNIQQNVLGGFAHEIFTNAITDCINFKYGKLDAINKAIAKADSRQRLEDIDIPFLNGSIEVKTCIIKDGNKLKFTTRKPKAGYYLLLGFTPDYEDFYCAYGILKSDVWKKAVGGHSANMDIKELQKVQLMEFAGKLKLDKKTGNVHCIPVTLGSIVETY